MAYRCRFCGEVTICDILVTDSESKMNGIAYDSSVQHSMVCRLCGILHGVPKDVKPATWEEFDFALASDDLIDKTNPTARDGEIPTLAEMGLPEVNGQPRPVVGMLHLLSKPMWKEVTTIYTLVGSAFLAAIVFFVANNRSGATLTKSLIAVAITLVIGGIASVIVNKLKRASGLADEYAERVDRFSRETGHSVDDMLQVAKNNGAFAKAVPVLEELAKDA